uniref:Myosin motor domain-containing protein n=3 Tax=Lotharella globosa TaxID=91324 RepID=A0A7S3YZR0_9EUKA|mmetsp:Transcript_18660/g.37717  ORF Transcript_18660/g.37717 Transcript_18660/m.37717 type:complete len:1600 (-) Transcript_18660:218-5017(-)
METKEEPPIDYEDMVFMPEFTGPLAVENVKNRFEKDKIYTNVSSILISLNPYTELGLYTKRMYQYYQFNKARDKPPPHLFAVAKSAYRQMLYPTTEIPRNQSILISGESGAGKTEATKLFLRYFARQSEIVHRKKKSDGNAMSIEARIIQANPILEAFGNAKTLRNDNSSRFGRWLNVYFSKRGKIMMGSLTQYLLEESRVVFQDQGERNYNVFYQVCAAWFKNGDERMDMKQLEYLNKSGCQVVKGVDDLKLYNELMECFDQLGFSKDEQTSVLNILKSVLCLGNVVFEEGPVINGKGTSKISEKSNGYVKTLSECLKINERVLTKTLTIQDMAVGGRGSFVSIPRSKDNAEANCNSLAKRLYGKLFAWLVERINKSFRASCNGEVDLGSMRVIGILDIFGFEAFKHNSFEQLCINLANEKLQQYFVKQVFKMELKVYAEEKIDVDDIPYPDNTDTLHLLEKTGGVFSLLRDELKLKTGTDMGFAAKLQKEQQYHPKFKAPRRQGEPYFTIKHFAEDVVYSAEGFLAKNRAKLTQDVKDMINTSTDTVVKEMSDETAPKEDDTERKMRRRGPRRKKKAAPTLAAQFQSQLNALLAQINSTESHFVRCIKPNKLKAAKRFDQAEVIRQLTTCGVIDAVTVRKLGYTNRMSHWPFFKRYGVIRGGNVYWQKGVDYIKENKKICEQAERLVPESFKKLIPIALWQSGSSIMFFKAEVQVELEKLLREVQDKAATKIGKTVRMFIIRRRFLRKLNTYKELQEAVNDPTASLEYIEGCLEKAKEIGVIPRLLEDAEKRIAKLVEARTALQNALRKEQKTLKLRVDVMNKALAKAEALIHNSNEQKAIHSVLPCFIELVDAIASRVSEACKDAEAGTQLREMISKCRKTCSRVSLLTIQLDKAEEVAFALRTLRVLDEVDERLKKAMRLRNLTEVKDALASAHATKLGEGLAFGRASLSEAHEVQGCLQLEKTTQEAIDTKTVEEMEKATANIEAEMREHPHWAKQHGSKLSDQAAYLTKMEVLLNHMREAVSGLNDTVRLAPTLGEAAISLLQDSLNQAKRHMDSANAAKLNGAIMKEMATAMVAGQDELKNTMKRMDAQAQEMMRKKMLERARKLEEKRKAEDEAERLAEMARKEALELKVEAKVRQLKQIADEDRKRVLERANSEVAREREEMTKQIEEKDAKIAAEQKISEGLRERLAKAEAEAKTLRAKVDELVNPKPGDLNGFIRAAMVRHSQQVTSSSRLIAWYTMGVKKGLDAEPAPFAQQMQSLQSLMSRPEVQSSGAVALLEHATQIMRQKAWEEVDGDDDDDDDLETDGVPAGSEVATLGDSMMDSRRASVVVARAIDRRPSVPAVTMADLKIDGGVKPSLKNLGLIEEESVQRSPRAMLLENADIKLEALKLQLQQADTMRQQALDGIQIVLDQQHQVAKKEAKLYATRLSILLKENARLKDRLTSKTAMAEEIAKRTVATLKTIRVKSPKPTAEGKSLRDQNAALMADLGRKCGDMVQMRMEIEELKARLNRGSGMSLFRKKPTPDEELLFQKSLVATRDETIELLEAALKDSNAFARKMYDVYEGKMKDLSKTVSKQRKMLRRVGVGMRR